MPPAGSLFSASSQTDGILFSTCESVRTLPAQTWIESVCRSSHIDEVVLFVMSEDECAKKEHVTTQGSAGDHIRHPGQSTCMTGRLDGRVVPR